MKNKETNPQEDLRHIRSMMERSSRFISLNGLSGVSAGIIALIAGFYAQHLLDICYSDSTVTSSELCQDLPRRLVLLALATIFLALAAALFFTIRKTRKQKLSIWNNTIREMLIHFSIPLIVGFVVCIAFYIQHSYVYVIPSMLVFYGLGLLGISNYTHKELRYLGILELLLGLFGFFHSTELLNLWMIGFGVLHIIYGIFMYRKYG